MNKTRINITIDENVYKTFKEFCDSVGLKYSNVIELLLKIVFINNAGKIKELEEEVVKEMTEILTQPSIFDKFKREISSKIEKEIADKVEEQVHKRIKKKIQE